MDLVHFTFPSSDLFIKFEYMSQMNSFTYKDSINVQGAVILKIQNIKQWFTFISQRCIEILGKRHIPIKMNKGHQFQIQNNVYSSQHFTQHDLSGYEFLINTSNTIGGVVRKKN